MIWAQSLSVFGVWIAYAVWLRRGSDHLRTRLRTRTRNQRILGGIMGFLGSAALLLGGLFAIQSAGGLVQGTLTGWAWGAVAILGCAFVHLQVLAAASMISLVEQSEPPGPGEPSESRSSE